MQVIKPSLSGRIGNPVYHLLSADLRKTSVNARAKHCDAQAHPYLSLIHVLKPFRDTRESTRLDQHRVRTDVGLDE